MLQRVKINDPTAPERRDLILPVELKGEGDKPTAKLVGYAARFNQEISLSDWFGGEFIEVIAPGAFTRTLRENKDVRALRNHDPNLILARGKNGTLRLTQDDEGLAFDLDLNLEGSLGRDTKADVERGDIDGCSFGFYVREEKIEQRKGEPLLRTLLDIELIEVSPAVTFPAYDSTSVAVRSTRATGRPLPSPAAELAYRSRSLLLEMSEDFQHPEV